MDHERPSNSTHVMDEIIAHGFPRESGRLIHALVGGSQLYGVKLEGTEFVSRGWVTLPRPEPERSKLLAVRRGEWSEDSVIAEAHRLFAELDVAVEHSPLPERVDLDAIGRLVTEICLDAWERWGWSGKRSMVLEL